ncbi:MULTISPECIES: ATP-dependent DNA helicase [unclassified Pseudomonas]|uniref:ATP-dependent DNA helicase n=1 Tax=unclassified Pseudomonas TaxID=196821 RepID=UPI000BC4FCBB|nr:MULTISPECIES: ATP-dependent DNA helicase [unclassified Pseudomonas]PVZ20021.1 Rad3-related DNA helicase [Pseudomonas sp. URIL14HWK12:I12]PVZ27087.1 Rad3-related DNA helicase [Pseudomonas sp. URIL14HWK12:I10]PVZ37976.1 Rad3-related DNA helicase [Pseudomonas sp. URIL14HWK12:I11]SNZ04930.1 Rad3-related DNA helicase [Pseudomonas sp. URIL14HWK12:I9]
MSYRVAVRGLCEFGARAGDLDLRFTPAPSALEGIVGHQQVAAGRGAQYESEVALEGQYGELLVRGRADGFDAARHCLEEVKTHRGDLTRQAANVRALHWAQAKVYGWLICQQRGFSELTVALVYLDVDSGKQTRFEERHLAPALQQVFEQLCQRYIQWAEQEQAWREARDRGLKHLAFPLAKWRPGQRELAETVYKAASTGRCLLAQAPTGIGKTLGTVFPALKAMAAQQLDVLLFLTAKTPGRRLALDALARLRTPAAPLRVLELVARDKACEYPGTACHGEACPLARGFYDRLPAARAQAAEAGWLDRPALREIALRHQVCPYYLSQEMARWADALVGDYNYWFDVSAWLHGLALQLGWRATLLVDEAHNLVDRARGMYSAELDQQRLAPLRKAPLPGLAGPLQRLWRAWNALNAEQSAPYQASPTPPAAWLAALQGCIGALNTCLNENPQGLQGPWLEFYFDALQVQRIAERFGQGHIFDSHLYSLGRQRRSRLCLRNLIPAQALAPRLQAAHSAVLFSATLSPARYFLDLLGLPADCAWLDVPSPFAAHQLQVRLAGHVSTRYQHREGSMAALAQVLAGQYRRQPGNYLAFFSSYQYLEQALVALRAEAPGVPVWAQAPRMGEPEREAFVGRFVEGGQGIGFAVLGGAFGEGIDLPGGRLIGAFIATLGLAQLNPVNEQLRQHLQQRYGAGYDYAYLYPGLHKVVQAAGRVIRDEGDQGVVVLIDDRFAQPQVQALLPRWWPRAEPCPPALPGEYGQTLPLLG